MWTYLGVRKANSVRRSLSVKYNSAAGNRFYSSGGQRNTNVGSTIDV